MDFALNSSPSVQYTFTIPLPIEPNYILGISEKLTYKLRT
jgi:hypothetical protein